MVTLRWMFAGCILLTVPLHSETPPRQARSHGDIRLELFGGIMPPRTDTSIAGAVQRADVSHKKSVGLAAVYSLLLPGMGELYAGDFSSGKYFLIAEGVLWLTYAAFEISGNALRDDARAFAGAHAGVNPSGKTDQYFVDVGNFASLAEYNDKRLRDREPTKLYDPSMGYAWQWDTEASRLTFRDQRVRSETMYNNRKFVIAGILINHVASAINAARAVIGANAAAEDVLGGVQFGANVLGHPAAPHGIVLTVSKVF